MPVIWQRPGQPKKTARPKDREEHDAAIVAAIAAERGLQRGMTAQQLAEHRAWLRANRYARISELAEEYAGEGAASSFQERYEKALGLLTDAVLQGQFAERGFVLDKRASDPLPLIRGVLQALSGGTNLGWKRLDGRWEGGVLADCWIERATALKSLPARPAEEPSPRRKRPQLDAVRKVLTEMFPNGVPDQATIRTDDLWGKVVKKLGKPVSKETVRRASGRRSK